MVKPIIKHNKLILTFFFNKTRNYKYESIPTDGLL